MIHFHPNSRSKSIVIGHRQQWVSRESSFSVQTYRKEKKISYAIASLSMTMFVTKPRF